MAGIGSHKEGCGLHFAGFHSQALPALPFLQQVIVDRALLRAVLAVEGVLALDYAYMGPESQFPAGIPQGNSHIEVRHGGVFNGGILQRGMFKADGTAGDHHIPGTDLQIDTAAGAYPDEGICADVAELLQSDDSRGAANAGGTDRNLLSQEGAGIDVVLPVHADMYRAVEISGDGLTAARVTGQEHIAAHIAFGAVDMILLFGLLHSAFSFV